MTSCCTPGADPTWSCPECGVAGPVVGVAVVRPHRSDAADGPWQHCPTPGCPVVYHLDDHRITDHELIAQVGHKALDRPRPVCFCFAHTAEDVVSDHRAHDGVSTIKAEVKAAVAQGFCACEHLNPGGRCCLPDIHRALRAGLAEEAAT